MKQSALEKASDYYAKAEAAIARAKTAKNYSEFKSAWAEFLINFDIIYNKLQAGTKGHPESSQWFEEIVCDFRKDPLLKYLRFARGAEEHGIEDHTELSKGHFSISGDVPCFVEHLDFKDGRITGSIRSLNGRLPKIESKPPTVHLVEVVNTRYKTSCTPPKEHMGQPLSSYSPTAIADLALGYFYDKIAKARDFLD